MPEARDLFRKQFGYLPVRVVRVPAALELIGAGSGIRHGLGITAALDAGVEIAFAPRTDAQCRLVSHGAGKPELFRPDNFTRNPSAPWADLPKAMLRGLHRRGVRVSGFDAAMLDNVPAGTGLDHCAPVEVAMVLAVHAMFPFRLGPGSTAPADRDNQRRREDDFPEPEKWAVAGLCLNAAREFLGMESPSLAQITLLAGRAWHLLSVDEPFSRTEPLPFPGCVCILSRELKVHARPATREMNELHTSLDSAATKLGLKSLRTAETGLVKANRERLTVREYECATYAVAETARAVGVERSLRNNDTAQFGVYVDQSGEHLRSLVPTEEPRLLLELGRSHRACFGARSVPACSNGAAVHLVAHHQAEEFMGALSSQYRAQTEREIRSHVCMVAERSVAVR